MSAVARGRPRNYLLVLIAIAAVAAGSAGAAESAWQYLENRDPYAKGVVAIAQHRSGDGGYAMVRCWSATRVFDVRVGFPRVEDAQLREVELQFDVIPSLVPAWRISPNRRALIIDRNHHAPVLSALRRANDVTMIASFADGTAIDATLHLRGSSAAIGRVLEVCGPLDSLLR
jgi:hypothetical protein